VIHQAKILEGKFEEGVPLTEIAVVGGKSDRDMAVDID
jgi:hypothetical protein